MSGNSVEKPGKTSYLPSFPSAKKIAGIGVALVVISSLGAYLYFCGPHLPASSMDWKFAAGGVILTGSVTVVAFIVLRRSSAETNVKDAEKGKAKVETREFNYSAEYVQFIEGKIQAYSESSSEEDYQKIKEYLTDLRIAEVAFEKGITLENGYEVPLIDTSLAFRLAESFADNQQWLETMIKKIDVPRLSEIMSYCDDIEDEEALSNGLANIYSLLIKDENKLVEIFAFPTDDFDDLTFFEKLLSAYTKQSPNNLKHLYDLLRKDLDLGRFLNTFLINGQMQNEIKIILNQEQYRILRILALPDLIPRVAEQLFELFDFNDNDLFDRLARILESIQDIEHLIRLLVIIVSMDSREAKDHRKDFVTVLRIQRTLSKILTHTHTVLDDRLFNLVPFLEVGERGMLRMSLPIEFRRFFDAYLKKNGILYS